MPRLRYSPTAKDDLKSIAAFIAEDKPGAARSWMSKVRAKCRLLTQHPVVGDALTEYGLQIRATYVGSYVIVFRHGEEAIDILPVFRGDQRFPLLD